MRYRVECSAEVYCPIRIIKFIDPSAVFVIDAYTKRIFGRHGIFKENAGYEEAQKVFMDNLPANTKLFNEYHALIVRLGKEFCRKSPKCGACPLKGFRRKIVANNIPG